MSTGLRQRLKGGHAGHAAIGWRRLLLSCTAPETFPAFLLGAVLLAGPGAAAEGRLSPPETLRCSRDHLTAFSGKVASYRRGAEKVTLRLQTDEATTETFTLKFPKAEGPVGRFLLQGGPFREEDWGKVEKAPGALRDGMRVIVWICEDDPRPIFDWRPGEESVEGPAHLTPR